MFPRFRRQTTHTLCSLAITVYCLLYVLPAVSPYPASASADKTLQEVVQIEDEGQNQVGAAASTENVKVYHGPQEKKKSKYKYPGTGYGGDDDGYDEDDAPTQLPLLQRLTNYVNQVGGALDAIERNTQELVTKSKDKGDKQKNKDKGKDDKGKDDKGKGKDKGKDKDKDKKKPIELSDDEQNQAASGSVAVAEKIPDDYVPEKKEETKLKPVEQASPNQYQQQPQQQEYQKPPPRAPPKDKDEDDDDESDEDDDEEGDRKAKKNQ